MSVIYNKYDKQFWDAVIEEFYLKNIQDPLIGHLFKDIEIDRIKNMNRTLVMHALSLSDESVKLDVVSAHKHLGITSVHFERFLYNFFTVLRSSNIDEEDLEFLLVLVSIFKDDLITS